MLGCHVRDEDSNAWGVKKYAWREAPRLVLSSAPAVLRTLRLQPAGVQMGLALGCHCVSLLSGAPLHSSVYPFSEAGVPGTPQDPTLRIMDAACRTPRWE